MKKWIAAILVISMVGCMFAGCGSDMPESKPLTTQAVQNMETENVVQEVEQTEPVSKTEVTIEETVVYDANDIKVTVTGIEESWFGIDLKLLVENNTERNIALSGTDVVVNNVSMGGNMYIHVAAGKKAYGTFSLYREELNTAGVGEIAVISTKDAIIMDTDNYETLAQVPFEVVTSLGVDYVQSLDNSGEVLYEAKGVTVIAKIIADEFYGKSVILYVENKSDKTVTVQAENVSVNGFTVDGWLYSNVYAGTVRFCSLGLYSTSLEENGITEVEDVSFTISLIDPNTFSTVAKSDELQVFVTE